MMHLQYLTSYYCVTDEELLETIKQYQSGHFLEIKDDSNGKYHVKIYREVR